MISFIVPAHNEARLIGSTLHALRQSARELQLAFQIIVVDDASDDATADIARACAATVLAVAHRHIAATRNAGAALARGGRLVFVDADTRVDQTVLRAAIQAMDDGAVGGGVAVKLEGNVSLQARLAAGFFAWMFRLTRIAPGCFLFCTRAAFDAVGGFDQTYYAGEDVAMSRALARLGRFVILREAVHTSARKLHTFSAGEHLQLALRFLWKRQRMLRSREHLGLWYGKRRD